MPSNTSSKPKNERKSSKPKTVRKSAKQSVVASSEQSMENSTIPENESSIQSEITHQETNHADMPVNPSSTNIISSINIEFIEPDPNQPRNYFAQEALEQLKQSIESTGLIEPILVRENESKPGWYWIVDGERRWRSCKELKWNEIACRILPKDSVDYALVSFTQNVHREGFTTMEKAVALDALFSKMKSEDASVEQKALVAKVKLSKSYVSELMKISNLEQEIKGEVLKSNDWTHSRLLQLAKITNLQTRKSKFDEIQKAIENKNKKKQSDNDEVVEGSQPDAANNEEEEKSVENEAQNQMNNKIKCFQIHANTFINKLQKFKKLIEKSNSDSNSIETVKPELNNILSLINEIIFVQSKN
ncbi:MAG: ParB/RepB/Spo0J family partition protein [Streptococcaceae bacterium]|jgi:ParB family chromosome partitioning protein|nr:ParB/RepB/Spo0J family partition protein [Streptococcaceae bacterium]